MIKVIIIGQGPSGISAAIYLKRAGIDPLVIGKDYGALEGYDDLVENFYGQASPIEGKAMIQNGIKQAKGLGIEVVEDAVISLSTNEKGFIVKTATSMYESKAVLLATGKKRETLKRPGFNQFRGKGISMCAVCDGYFYRKKKIAVIGCGAYMLHELEHLKRMTNDVMVFTDGHPLDVSVDVPVIDEGIKKFGGDTKLTHIETKDHSYEVDGVFIALGTPSSVEFASQLGVIVEKGNLVVDKNYQTNVEGLFAAGDIIGGKLQIAKAVYDGMMAADAIFDYLKKTL